MATTNRGWLSELLWGRWCLFKAGCYGMVTLKQITTGWDAQERLMYVEVEGKVFYQYGVE